MDFAEFSKDLDTSQRVPFRFMRLEEKNLPRITSGRSDSTKEITVIFCGGPSENKNAKFLTRCAFGWLSGGMRELTTIFSIMNKETGTIFACSLTYENYLYRSLRLRVAKNERELLEGFFAFWDIAGGLHDDRNRIINTLYFPNWLTA